MRWPYVASMPSAATMIVFAGASMALLVVPGPAVLFIVARSATQGRRAGLVSVAGVHTATAVHVLAAVAGLSALTVSSANAFTIIKVAGALYLVALGIRVLIGHRASVTTASGTQAPRRLLWQAFTVNLLNPKVALFFLAFLPQFVHRNHGTLWTQTLILGAIYIALGLCSDGLYAVTAARLGNRLQHRRDMRRTSKVIEGTSLIGLGVASLAFPSRATR